MDQIGVGVNHRAGNACHNQADRNMGVKLGLTDAGCPHDVLVFGKLQPSEGKRDPEGPMASCAKTK